MDGDRAIRRHDIAHTGKGRRLDGLRERNRRPVDDRIDPVGKLHDDRGIACRHDAKRVHASARRSF